MSKNYALKESSKRLICKHKTTNFDEKNSLGKLYVFVGAENLNK